MGKCHEALATTTYAPLFWTTKDKTIIAAFSFTDDDARTIYEFDPSTLETVGTPFEGHTMAVRGLALSLDCALLASASVDGTIKLWAFESRQLLGSVENIQDPYRIILSPNSLQLAVTTWHGTKIYIGDIPPGIFEPEKQVPSVRRNPVKPVISFGPRPQRRSSTTNPQQPPPEAMLQDLAKYITKDSDYPVARGGFGEIWKCTFRMHHKSIKVAVKALQVYGVDHIGAAKEKKMKRIQRELRICAGLKHANILPVYGYTSGFGPFTAIVSPWAENGNLTTYLNHEGETLTLVRRFQILRDIIAGLQYLHVNSVIHGDFNGPNVLIHGDGTACVADFGLSLMYSEVISASQASWTSTLKGNLRWMAPELLVEGEDGSQVRPSKRSDIYSFGGIMLQVLTNKIPYHHLSNDAAIILCIAKSENPSRSRYPALPNKYWYFMEQCWSADPQDRPSTERVNRFIKFISMIQLNTNRSNIVCHALLNNAVRDYDILLITEPWYGDIGNNTKGPASLTGWQPILPLPSVPPNVIPRVMAYIKNRPDFMVTLRSDLAMDADIQILQINQGTHPPTILVNMYNQKAGED
ncbi:kinase-like domain-containing protein, partial [Suillus paluster]|uniref:kinase-like domain-containing protein n=1 Tax=Suillus paluster TaxID=48578 RepID=UPI001B865053